MTVRLGEVTARELDELAQRYRSRSAAVQDASRLARTTSIRVDGALKLVVSGA